MQKYCQVNLHTVKSRVLMRVTNSKNIMFQKVTVRKHQKSTSLKQSVKARVWFKTRRVRTRDYTVREK